jgi:hypothetical protein
MKKVSLPRFASKSTQSACGLGHTVFLFTQAMLASEQI